MLATTVPQEWREHEFVQFFLRGTGLYNHHASYFKIDDNVMLDHAFYKGLYLAIIDRRDLTLVEHGIYDTSKVPGSTILNDGFFPRDDFL